MTYVDTTTTGTTYSPFGDPFAMYALSTNLVNDATSYAQALITGASSITPLTVQASFPTIAAAPQPQVASMPALLPVTWQSPTAPAAFGGSLNLGAMPPTFAGTSPTLNFGAPPAGFSGQLPSAPVLDLNFTYPTVEVSLPSAPALMSLSTVTFTPLAIPSFTATPQALTLSPPAIVQYVEKAWYASTELSTLQSSLISAMTNGQDTGLDVATQTNLFNAGYEREYRAQADALAALLRDSEVLGYAYPPGAFLDARNKIYTETQNTIAGLSRDIMVKQAEMHLDNVMKSRELAVSLEGKLIDYYNQVNQRAFDFAVKTTENLIASYNAQVQAFSANLEVFKTQALVYDTQIKGIQAYVDQLRAQIDFEKTKAEINVALVQAYKTEVDAALANLEVYKTQVEIIKTEAEVAKVQVDVYGAQIQAFVGTVNAYTAQVEGYKAGVEAQGVVENVYKTQVDAYAAEVNAGVAVINANVAGYRAQIDAYTAQLETYKAQLQAQVSQAQSLTAYNTSEVEVFKGEVTALASYNQTLTEQWKAVVDTNERVAEVAIKTAEANSQLQLSTRNLIMEADKAGAQVTAQLGAAALNAIHWSNSFGYQDSQSASTSTSTSTSTSESTNYNYDSSV